MAYATYADLKNRTSGGSSSVGSSSSSKSSKKIVDYASLKKAVAPNIDKVKNYLAERDKQKRTVENFNKATEEAKKYQVEAEKAQKKQAFWETIANLPKEIVKSAFVRPAVSLAEIPKNVYGTATGKENTFGEVDVPFLGKVESYQSEAKRTAGEIVDNQKPVTSILKPMGEAVLDVGSLGIGGGVVKQGVKAGLVSGLKKGVVEGALYGAGYGATQALGEGQNFKEAGKTIGMGAILGGAAGGVLGGGGGLLARQAERRALSNAVKKIEAKVGKMDMHEIALVEEGLKQGLTEDSVLRGIEKSREPFKATEIEKPKFAEQPAQTKTEFERAKNLAGEDREIETRAFNKIQENEEEILQRYSEEHGKIVNADDFRKEFIDEGYTGSNAEAVQEPSSYLAKKAYTRALENEGKFATFYSGGSGSGKTSAIKHTTELQPIIDKSSVVLDSNLSSYGSATKKIDEAVKAGKVPYIIYTYRDPIDAFVNGVIKRMKKNKSEMGRIVPNRIIAENHIGSFEVFRKLKKDGIHGDIIDNSLGYKKQRLSTIEDIEAKFKYTEKELTEKLNKEAEKLYKKGELTKEQYGRYVGEKVEVKTKKSNEEQLIREAKKYKSAEEFVKAKSGNQGIYNADYEKMIQKNRSEAKPLSQQEWDFLDAETKGDKVKIYRLSTNGKILPGDNVSVYDVSKYVNKDGSLNITGARMGITKLGGRKDVKLVEQWIPKKDLYQTPAGTQVYAPNGAKSLTDIWNKAKKESLSKKAVKSEFAERLNKELPENLKINEDYNVVHMKGEVDKAENLINKDLNKAIEIATGVEKSDANTQTATSIVLAEKAKNEGDWQTVAQLYNLRRIANTRRGQEIAMEKMSVLMNPEEKYMKQVVDARLNGVRVGSADIADILKRKPKAERVFERTKKQTADLKKELQLSVKIEKAEKVFSNLICK